MDLASKLFKGDRVIWVIFMFLCLISAVEVFSATSTLAYKSATHWEPIARHASFMLGGFVLVLLMHNLPCRLYALLAGMAVLSVVLLLLLFVPGLAVVINGEPRWLNLFGVTFQPSEIAKISLIGYTAFVMSKRSWFTDKQMFWFIQGATAVICGLIVITNGSTAILLFCIIQMMMFFGQISMMRLLKCWGTLVLILVMVVTLLIAFPGLKKYMPDRIDTWMARIERFVGLDRGKSDEKTYKVKPVTVDGKVYDMNGDDYQVVHAKIALARGGVWGNFPGHGQQRDFLPQAYSDFIYAIIIEETGIAGGFFVLFLYMALLVRVGMIARRCDKLFPKFLVLGCGLLLVVQALINMAVAVDMIPVTGQPLPLVSRGGTSTVISCAYIGIILSVSRFGAGIGNEEDVDEQVSDEISAGMESRAHGYGMENVPATIECETRIIDGTVTSENTNPLETVVQLEEETATETKI